jgi:hypothetical protein
LHIDSNNGSTWWYPDNDGRFHGDEELIKPCDDPSKNEIFALYAARQDEACRKIKREHFQLVDLHDFEALKLLNVHATDLLGSMDKDDPSNYISLSTVLPPTLEELIIRYSNFFSDWDPQLEFIYEYEGRRDTGQGVAWTMDKWAPADHIEWYESYWEHLFELLLQKAEKFPALKVIDAHLDEGWPLPGEHILGSLMIWVLSYL